MTDQHVRAPERRPAAGVRAVRPTARQVNLGLEVLIGLSLVTGVLSWIVGLDTARAFTFVHAVSGYAMLLLAPLKMRGSIRSGFRRRRSTRWLSAAFGMLVLATIGLGFVHSVGLWFGVGEWSALWTHLLLGFTVLPFAAWHVTTRPVRPGRTDLGRRAFLSAGAVTAAGTAVVVAQEGVLDAIGGAGGVRRGTGSHEVSSFDPTGLPVVSWFDDRTPRTPLADWRIDLDGEPLVVAALAARATPIVAVLDCTGGWWSEQRWDVVPLAELVAESAAATTGARSVKVTSATGYARLFPLSDLDEVYVCTGYDGVPLRRGHGGPLRLVVPGRRGPWWVKWITSIEVSSRPSWLQLPFPPT